MTPPQIADTALFVGHLRRQLPATDYLTRNGPSLLVPFIVVGELISGALLSDRPEVETHRVEALLAAFPRLWPDDTTVWTFAQIRAELVRAGAPIGAHDMWLAALARQNGFPIVSNDDDFRRVRGVTMIGW